MRRATLMPSLRRRPTGLPLIGLVAMAAAGAQAQTANSDAAATGRAFSIVPTFNVSTTLTDNSRLTPTDRQSDLITLVTPGLRITSNGGRVKGFLDYSLSGVVHAKNSSSNELQNALNAAVTAEAIENWAYLDVSANISQQTISAFGTQSNDSTLVNENRTEARTFSLSPYVRGSLAGLANYNARLTHTSTHSSASTASNVTSTDAALRLSGANSLGIMNWSADASRQVIDFSAGRQTENDRLRAVLTFAVDPQLRLSVIGGREANNYVSLDKQSHSITGFGIDWTPTERTKVSASGERRFFGNSHSFVFEHRTPRSVWRISDSRDISTGFNQPALGSQGTIYDLLFAQFASLQPDPVLRAQLVNDFLRAAGIPPSAVLPTGSLTSAVTLQRQQELSFALLGLRDTVTFAASQSEARRLDSVVAVSDDFANSNQVRQRALSVNWAHRLTPQSALNLLASLARTSGTVGSQSTSLRTIALNWTSSVGPRSNLVLGARHAVFDGATRSYTESAVTASLGIRF